MLIAIMHEDFRIWWAIWWIVVSSLSWAEFRRQREICSLQGISAIVFFFLFGVGFIQ